MKITQQQIISAVVDESLTRPDSIVTEMVQGRRLVGVQTEQGAGICSRVPLDDALLGTGPDPGLNLSLHQLLPGLEYQDTEEASYALAAVNCILNNRRSEIQAKAQELILELGRGKNVAVIGHFPFVHKIKNAFNNFWVLEKRPRDFDLPSTELPRILPRAQIIAITATTLLNGTLAQILNLCHSGSIRMLMGPSTPMACCLGPMGIHYLAGSRVLEPREVFTGIKSGLCFRSLSGVESFIQPTGRTRT
ncbi:DUF364 domain-containing protein [Desulfonatronospira sp.]|uniref:Rossmann-like domain-containing protein n=1 Tax=Desulfonatronospira sp. TaxID=1962951 RepID=UPI0025BB11F1|nr:DUF364 domain-containing protein [Desulfonatronospira sp.]